jgi:hypothetical protein
MLTTVNFRAHTFDAESRSFYYDADGSGSEVAILIGTLSMGSLVAKDILIG